MMDVQETETKLRTKSESLHHFDEKFLTCGSNKMEGENQHCKDASWEEKNCNALSSIGNKVIFLNSSENNLLGIDSECQDDLFSLEQISVQCLDNSSQFEGHCNEDFEQFQKTDLCNTENDKNQRFPSVGNFTWRQSKVSVILHKLPDCIYNTYSCNNSIYVDNLQFVKTSNCCNFDTTSSKSCAISSVPHLCHSEKNIPALNLEENIFCNEMFCDSKFKIPNLSVYVQKSLWLCGSKIYQSKITNGIPVNIHVPKNLWSYSQTKQFSFLFKKFNSYISNDLKSVYVYSFEIAEPHMEANKDHEDKMGHELEMSRSLKKPCIKLHKLCNDIFSLYMNNQPIILKKDISQETLNNADQLGDCSSVIEFNLESYAHVIDNFIEDLNSVLPGNGKDDNFINLCEKSNDGGNKKTRVGKQKIKSHMKKSEKKKNAACKGIPNKTQKNKVIKKLLLRKKHMLLEKCMKSLLSTHRMKNFLQHVTYSELHKTLKKLRNKSKKNQINEEFVSFVGRIINFENFSKKKVKAKKCPSSRRIPLKNFKNSMPEKVGGNTSSEFKSFKIYIGHQAMEENASRQVGFEAGADPKTDGKEAPQRTPAGAELLTSSQPAVPTSSAAGLQHRATNASRFEAGCSTNVKENQNSAKKKQVTNSSSLAKGHKWSGLLNIVKKALEKRKEKKKKSNLLHCVGVEWK